MREFLVHETGKFSIFCLTTLYAVKRRNGKMAINNFRYSSSLQLTIPVKRTQCNNSSSKTIQKEVSSNLSLVQVSVPWKGVYERLLGKGQTNLNHNDWPTNGGQLVPQKDIGQKPTHVYPIGIVLPNANTP